MYKFISLIIICLLQLSCQNNLNYDNETAKLGAFTNFRDLTSDDTAIFHQLVKNTNKKFYLPIKVSTQVVAGINYQFICHEISDNSPKKQRIITIFIPLPGQGEPQITNISYI
ncbi:MAG: hypothetical protein ACRC37_01030 [Lentisphaeria bacterium]